MYYFYSCQVKVSRLNIDLYPTNFFQKLFNVRPDDILNSKISNFLLMAYLIFFLWKIAELVMGHYNVPKINGVKLTGSFWANLILSVIAIIILFWVASSSGGTERMKSVILSTAKGLGRYTEQGTASSHSAALALLIFETYQMMTPEEIKELSDDNDKEKPSYVKNKLYKALDALDPKQTSNKIGKLNNKIKNEYDRVQGYFDDFAKSLWEWSKNTNTTDNIYKPDDKKKSEDDKIRDYLLDTIEFFNKINDDTKIEKYRINEKEAILKRIKGLQNKVNRLRLTGQYDKAKKINHVISLLNEDLDFYERNNGDTADWRNIRTNLGTYREKAIKNYNLIFPTYDQNQDGDNQNKSLNRNALLENKPILKYLMGKIKEFSKVKLTNQSNVIAFKTDVSNNDDAVKIDIKPSDEGIGNKAVADITEPDNTTPTNTNANAYEKPEYNKLRINKL